MSLFLAVAMLVGAMPAWSEQSGNMVSFRGGFAGLNNGRGNQLFTDARNPLGAGTNDSATGWYMGGALDLMLSNDLWGMMENVAALGEIGVEFKRFNSQRVTNTSNLGVTAGTPPCVAGGAPTFCATSLTPSEVQLTMLTVDIAPKLKFNQNGRLRPWLIPAGLDFHVISPPSNQTQYLDIGVQFGAGLEYQIWKEFWLGVDGRYHLAANMTNTINNFGTVGAYVGIGF